MHQPIPLPLKLAELTLRRKRSDIEVRGMLHHVHQDHGAVFCVLGIEDERDMVRERFFLMCAQHLEHLAQSVRGAQNSARAFEHMLTALNQDLARLGNEFQLRKEKCHLILGICSKNQLFISGFGDLLALFFHKTAQRRFSIYELHTQLGEATEAWEDHSCHVVLDGELHEGDVLYIASHIPASMLSQSTLQDVLVTLPAKGALERLEGFIPPAMPYAGIAVQVGSEERKDNLRVNPLGSLTLLQKTQERTADVLGERLPETKENAHIHTSWFGRTDIRATLLRLGVFVIKKLSQGVTVLLHIVQTGLRICSNTLRHFFLKQTRNNKKILALRQRLTNSPPSPLIGIILIGALFFLLTLGIVLVRTTARTQEQEGIITSKLDVGEKLLSEVEGKLIYNDMNGAHEKLIAAQENIENLSPKSPENQDRLLRLQASLALLTERTQGITRVNPTISATLPDNATGATGVAQDPAELFTPGLEAFRMNSLSGSWEAQNITLGIVASPVHAAQETPTTTLIVDNTQRLARYNNATQTLNPLPSGTEGLKSVDDIIVYNGTLYILVTQDEQIVKMRPQGDGYEAGTPWISTRANSLTNARALTIDGSIYVLTNDTVRVFFGGKEQVWALGTLTTPLKNPVDIFTTPESRFINILDPQNARVVIAEKSTGNIIAQYVNDAFKSGITLAVDEAKNTMTILTPTTSLHFTPNHLIQ